MAIEPRYAETQSHILNYLEKWLKEHPDTNLSADNGEGILISLPPHGIKIVDRGTSEHCTNSRKQ